MRALVLFLTLLIQVVFALSAAAAPASSAHAPIEGLNTDGSLDRVIISKAYFEGDFDKVITALEAWRKMQPNPSKEDKIYVYKYLSVIYAANAETRPKAESYMYQLLKLMPSIELMDLYISDNIEAIFNSVRLRFEQQSKLAHDSGQGKRASAPSTTVANGGGPNGAHPERANAGSGGMPERKRTEEPALKSHSHWGMWTAGLVGIVVVATGYFVLSKPAPRVASAPPDTLNF
jgi:hypothetical protein